MMKRIQLIAFLLVLLSFSLARAQTPDDCRSTGVNLQGTTNANITIDNSAGGVIVMTADPTRCSALICETDAIGSGFDMNCCPTSGPQPCTPTVSHGFGVPAGQCLALGTEGQSQWSCIRTSGSNATAKVLEALP